MEKYDLCHFSFNMFRTRDGGIGGISALIQNVIHAVVCICISILNAYFLVVAAQ